MEYITERRGGYDEWTDEYKAILGLILNDGTEIRERVIDGEFTDQHGNQVEVELPMRRTISEKLTIERYEPEYDYWELTLSQFEECLDGGTFDSEKAKNL